MRKDYCTKLTKEDLIKGGISLITDDCQVFGPDGKMKAISVNAQGYLQITIYEVDENGNKIKCPIQRKIGSKLIDTYIYKTKTVSLQRAMWAWFHEEGVPAGYVVDHISNKHDNIEDYQLNNLQLLTPLQNISKERFDEKRILKCDLRKNIDYYLAKLDMYTEKYVNAKKDHDAHLVHLSRCNISLTKARIRYWLINNGIDQAINDWFNANADYDETRLKVFRLEEIKGE